MCLFLIVETKQNFLMTFSRISAGLSLVAVDYPHITFSLIKELIKILIRRDEIVSLVRHLNPNKASGSDGISAQMLLLCDDSIGMPQKIIFENILSTSLYPDMWKLANVSPILKKGDKQFIKNYRPISFLPICGKMFEKIILIIFIIILIPAIL